MQQILTDKDMVQYAPLVQKLQYTKHYTSILNDYKNCYTQIQLDKVQQKLGFDTKANMEDFLKKLILAGDSSMKIDEEKGTLVF